MNHKRGRAKNQRAGSAPLQTSQLMAAPIERKQEARAVLIASARDACKKGFSMMEWEESTLVTTYAAAAGVEKEIPHMSYVAWALEGKRM